MLTTPVMAILRGVEENHLKPLIDVFLNVKIDTVEITMNTDNAPSLLYALKRQAANKLHIGAGTVTDLTRLKEAIDAGAEYIVTPVVNQDVITECVKRKIPVFLGALTPTEIWKAWKLGAKMVKVFPAGLFGPKYFSDIKGPFNDIKLMAVGGVKPENVESFFKCGASAVAIGGSILSKEQLNKGDYKEIESYLISLISKIPTSEK